MTGFEFVVDVSEASVSQFELVSQSIFDNESGKGCTGSGKGLLGSGGNCCKESGVV